MNMTHSYHLTVAAVLEQNGRFLFVEEKIDNKLVINQPAGHVDPQEFPVIATVRETLEETGWRYHPTAIVGIYYYHPSPHLTYQRICFTGNLLEFVTDYRIDPAIVRHLWLTREELSQQPNLRTPMVLRCVDDYLAGKRYNLDLLTSML